MVGLLALGLALAGATSAQAQVPTPKLFIDNLNPSTVTPTTYTTETNYETNSITTVQTQHGNVTVGGNTWTSINDDYVPSGMTFANNYYDPSKGFITNGAGSKAAFYQPTLGGTQSLNSDGNANQFLYEDYVNSQPGSTTFDASIYGVQSVFLISPLITVKNGSVVTFWTKGSLNQSGAQGGDQLKLLFSTSSSANFDIGTVSGGNSTVGTATYSEGDFTKQLLDINPGELPDGQAGATSTGSSTANLAYPTTWTQYSITITGLPTTAQDPGGNVTGRFAFQYLVTHANWDSELGYGNDIGLDDFTVNGPEPPSVAMLLCGSVVGGGVGLRRWRGRRRSVATE